VTRELRRRSIRSPCRFEVMFRRSTSSGLMGGW
jgi:hypothetical protein